MELIIVYVLLALAIGTLLYELRIRKPEQLLIYEVKDGFGLRKSNVYPRHFCLSLPRAAHSFQLAIDASAKGNLDVRVKLAVSAAASLENLQALIRVGGWHTDVVARAAKEFEIVLQGYVKQYAEKYDIEQLSSENIYNHLIQKCPTAKASHGLDIISLAVQSFEPINVQISEALRQREHARILEQTEIANQKARIAAAKAKMKAEEEIAGLDHELELKKLDLKRIQLEKESVLANVRVEEELKRDRMRLAFEKDELEMLKSNPELLLLTPQAARLAEASQNLKNARTVVSLSPTDVAQGTDLLGIFHTFLQNALESVKKKKSPKTESSNQETQ
jgi:hypothetical protein